MCILKILLKCNKKNGNVQHNLENNQDDMDDLDFDEMNDVWDEID